MNKYFKGKRFAYVKSGNSAEELRLLSSTPTSIPDGPLTFIAQFLALFGHNQSLLLSFGYGSEPFSSGSCSAISYERFSYCKGPVGTVFSTLRRFFLTFFHLLWFKPDYILCASYRQSLWASYLVSKLLNCTLVHARHNRIDPAKGILNNIVGSLDRAIIKRLHVICHGTYLKTQLIEIGVPEKQICEFQPGYRSFYENTIVEDSLSEDITDKGKLTVIGFIGRIVEEKGVFDLLEACSNRMQKDTTLTLLYVGTGLVVEELRKKSRSLQLENQVIILGYVPHNQLGSVVRQCKFVVTPTQSIFPEGFGMAALEPMIFGRPVIVPNFGPFPSFVHDGVNGLLYTVDSVKSLSNSINRMLDDLQLYANLSEGAKRTGAAALDPSVTFADAIVHAFSADCHTS